MTTPDARTLERELAESMDERRRLVAEKDPGICTSQNRVKMNPNEPETVE